MIGVFFKGTILAKQSSMVAAITLSILFWVIFAKNLEFVLILIDKGFDYVINLERHSLISIEKTIILALAS